MQVGAFLIALRWKGVTVEELTAFARRPARRPAFRARGCPTSCASAPPHDGSDHVPPLDVAACADRRGGRRARAADLRSLRAAQARPDRGQRARAPRPADDLGSLRGRGLGGQDALRGDLRLGHAAGADGPAARARRDRRAHAALDGREADRAAVRGAARRLAGRPGARRGGRGACRPSAIRRGIALQGPEGGVVPSVQDAARAGSSSRARTRCR